MVFTFDELISPPEYEPDDYTEQDAYSDWVGEQPDGADTSWDAWKDALEAEFDATPF